MKRYRFGELVFSWDERKATANVRRHGVRFEEAATVFIDPGAREYDDPDHSQHELRFLLVGHSFAGRLLLVVHAEKDDTIRIISARRVTPREREAYESDA
ncbi:MAG TPA: BrnT family toxin [Polyangiaceae bacterium]|nr:BrnT family toxin [Polyangiaceae bacterium]